MGGRGARSASGEMFDRSGAMGDQAFKNLRITDEKPANGSVIRDFIASKLRSVEDNPALQGQIYNQLHTISQGKISGRTIGAYSPSQKKIIIDSRLSPAQQRTTVAHELGHALAITPPKGFRTDVQAFESAYKQYKKTHPKASETSFAAKISNYATEARGEAFAEAFKDVSVNGKKAKPESLLIIKHWKK